MRETTDISESKPKARSVPMTTTLPLSLSSSSSMESSKPEATPKKESLNVPAAAEAYDWKLEHPLPPFPADFCLQRHNTFVANTSPDIILERLGRRLRHAACDCHWNGKGQLDIVGKKCKFSIFLWRNDDESNSNDNSTLVEMQRLQGCSVATQWCRRRIFRAIVEPSGPCCDLLEFPESPCVPESCKNDAASTEKRYPPQTTGFEQVEGLLKSNCRRQNQLGLEQMQYLLRKEPLETTKRVFQGHEFINYLQKYIHQDKVTGREETASLLAWQFLAQAFAVVANNEQDTDRVVIDKALLQECHLEQAIQQCLKRVEECPREATFAIQCWYWIDHFVPLPLDDKEALSNLKKAHAYGKKHNHCLEQESSKMIQILTLANCSSKQLL